MITIKNPITTLSFVLFLATTNLDGAEAPALDFAGEQDGEIHTVETRVQQKKALSGRKKKPLFEAEATTKLRETLLKMITPPHEFTELQQQSFDQNSEMYIDTIAQALEDGADLNIKVGKQDLSALHIAAMHSLVRLAEIVLARKGIRVSPRNADQAIPLHLAAEARCPIIVRLLLKHGSYKNKLDNLNYSVFDYALGSKFNNQGKSDVEKLRNFTDNTPVLEALLDGKVPVDATSAAIARHYYEKRFPELLETDPDVLAASPELAEKNRKLIEANLYLVARIEASVALYNKTNTKSKKLRR